MDYTINWTVVAPIILAIVAVITLFLRKYELLNLKNKHYGDKLDSSTRYFEKFYEGKDENQLVLDRAAQELARCRFVDANLVNRLIEYHQNFLIDFDEMTRLFEQGYNYIIYHKSSNLNTINDLKLKPLWKLGLRLRTILFILGYFFFAFIGFYFLLLEISAPVYTFSALSLITSIFIILLSVSFILAGFLFLKLEDNLSDANKFIQKITAAEKEYKKIKKPRHIILLPNNRNPQ